MHEICRKLSPNISTFARAQEENRLFRKTLNEKHLQSFEASRPGPHRKSLQMLRMTLCGDLRGAFALVEKWSQ
jgi:hypothetical protein